MRYLITLVALFALSITPAYAAKDKGKVQKEIAQETPITKWIDAENSLLDTLPRGNKDVFFIFRNKHAVMRTIDIVHRDIKNAVNSCSKANPDMKKEMRGRLKQWEKAVFPILKEARKFLAVELKEQEAFHVTDYKHVMKLNDEAYEFSESKITKNSVTSVKACNSLLASMDATEDKLVGLLQTILLPEEVVRERMEQAKKAEEKSKK